MANPVATIGVSGDSSYAPPTFQGWLEGSGALAQALMGIGAERRKKEQRERYRQRLGQMGEQLRTAAGSGGTNPDAVLKILLANPDLAADPNTQAVMNALGIGGKPKEEWEPVKDAAGNIIGQRNMATNRIMPHPAGRRQDSWVPIKDADGNIIGQQNEKTGEAKSYPRGQQEPDPAGIVSFYRQKDDETYDITSKRDDDPSIDRMLDEGWIKGSPPRGLVNVNVEGDQDPTIAALNRIDELVAENKPENERAIRLLKKKVTYGTTIPRFIQQVENSVPKAKTSIENIYELIKTAKDEHGRLPLDLLNPEKRAKLNQYWKALTLEISVLKDRGANLTGNEEAMVEGILGGDPTSAFNRLIRSPQSFLDAMKVAASYVDAHDVAAAASYGGDPMFTKPWSWETETRETEARQSVPEPFPEAPAEAPASSPLQENPYHGRFDGFSLDQLKAQFELAKEQGKEIPKEFLIALKKAILEGIAKDDEMVEAKASAGVE